MKETKPHPIRDVPAPLHGIRRRRFLPANDRESGLPAWMRRSGYHRPTKDKAGRTRADQADPLST